MSKKILVVDDEESILTLLQYNLERENFDVTLAKDGKIAFENAISGNFDMIILDLMIPKMDGLEVCKKLKQNKVMTPILILTAKDEELEKIYGLEIGADDYLTKPFSPREVVARVRAILRRSKKQLSSKKELKKEITIGSVVINVENHEAYLHNKNLELTPKEFELLLYMANHKGKVLNRDQLLNAVWDYNYVGDTRIVDVHISHLRDKIEPNTKKPVYIKTIRGMGYKMNTPAT